MGLNVRKPVFKGFANNKGADQPLISAFVIHFMESIIFRIATNEISISKFQASLCS